MSEAPTVLRDAQADKRLLRDGFVTLPVIDAALAHRLRDAFLELRGQTGSGFSIDLTIADDPYRRRADAAIAEVLDEPVARLFVDHTPFLRSFLGKYQGDESEMYLHQDWSYVDERRGARTYVAWVALQDITGDNGQLRVLRGSHRIDDMPRGSNLVSPMIELQEAISDRLLSVPVRAGDAIVFDNALVHSSYPNHTAEPRVAAAVGMRPSAEPLCYFRRTGPGRAARYDIDEEFFFHNTPLQLLERPPDLEPVEDLPVPDAAWTAEDLGRSLDRGLVGWSDRFHRGVRRSTELAREVPQRAAWSLVKVNERLIERYGPPPTSD